LKISTALAGLQRVYIETAPFIYFVEEHQLYSKKMENVFNVVDRQSIEIITSVITLSETLAKPLKVGDSTVEQGYRRLLQQTQHVSLVSVNTAIADETAQLRARYNLRTPDALHLATAMKTNCDVFLTNDLVYRRVQEIVILILGELEED